MNFKEYYIKESSTDKAKGTLEAIIGSLKNAKEGTSKEMLDMAKGIMDHFKKEGSFAPKQAQWIYNTSQSLFK